MQVGFQHNARFLRLAALTCLLCDLDLLKTLEDESTFVILPADSEISHILKFQAGLQLKANPSVKKTKPFCSLS